MQTTMRVSGETRDALARIAENDLGGVSLDEALRIVLFEYQTSVALMRLSADPEALAEYRDEAAAVADVDVTVSEW
jgi:hypothetical protein